jgi:ABC-type phosphate transport system substrate-binding protein
VPGCVPDAQLASCGFNAPASGVSVSAAVEGQVNTAVGNPTLLADVSKDPNGLGFCSYGITLSNAAASPVVMLGLIGHGQNVPVVASAASIKAGSTAGFAGTFGPGQFAGWRPLNYITIGTPTGEIAQWINFVTQPGVDTTLCALKSVNYLSPYA